MHKSLSIIVFLFCSVNVFGQELLGKDYDYIINELKSNNIEYVTKKIDEESSSITRYSKDDKYKDEVNEVYYFHKIGNEMECYLIVINEPKRYKGGSYWKDFFANFKNGAYEDTNYVDTFDEPIYKSSKKWSKNEHYMTFFHLTPEILLDMKFSLTQPDGIKRK